MLETYNKFIDRINDNFVTPHLQIQKFEEGFYEDMQSFETADEQFPFMWLIPTSVDHLENSVSQYNIRVYFIDILEKDNSNERDILSDQLSISRDFVNWLRLNEENGFNILNTPTSIPVKSVLLDYTAGWYVDLSIEVETEGSDCTIPFTGITGTTVTCPSGSTIFNSTSAYTQNVFAGYNLTLPDTPIFSTLSGFTDSTPSVSTGYTIADVVYTDSDGSTGNTAEYGSTIVCTPVSPATIVNSGATYSTTTPAGSTLVLPNINVSGNSKYLFTFPSVEDVNVRIGNGVGNVGSPDGFGNWFVSASTITNSGNTYNQNVPAESGYTLPNITHIDSNGSNVTLPAQTPFTASTCETGSTIFNSTSGYTQQVLAGSNLTLPDTNIFSTSSGYTNTTPSVSTGFTIPDVVYTDSDGSTGNTVEYGTTIVCTPPNFGDTILTRLKKEYSEEALWGFSLEYIDDDWRDANKPVITVRREGDNATSAFTPTEITGGTMEAWVSAGGGTEHGKITKWHDQTGHGYYLFRTTNSQQGYIVSGGTLTTDSNGKPTMVTSNNTGYQVGGNSLSRALDLFNNNGVVWVVGKRGDQSGISYMWNFAGNPAVCVANQTQGASCHTNAGSPTTTVNGTQLSSEIRSVLWTAINDLEAITFVEDINWEASSSWSTQVSVTLFLSYPVGSQLSEFVAFSKNPSDEKAIILADRNAYYNYYI